MKIALITDQHFGARNDSLRFDEYFDRFYNDVFFPYLLENEINHVIMLGDTFDRRKYTNNFILERCKKYYFDKLKSYGITVDCLIGNHDIYYKSTNEHNIMNVVAEPYDNINVIVDPTEVEYDGCKILMVPWICDANRDKTLALIESTKAQIVMGHLELEGFEMYKGAVQAEGMSPVVFRKFELVCSGHYHHKSMRGNIHYLGSPYEMSWSDYNDDRGFHVFDTDTRDLQYIRNPYKMFYKLYFNDSVHSIDSLISSIPSYIKNAHVKVMVEAKINQYNFEMYLDAVEKMEVSDYQIVEYDMLRENDESDDDILTEEEDTPLLIKRIVTNQLDDAIDKASVEAYMISLYEEASELVMD